MKVSVDGRLYIVNGSATIRIPAGYFNVTASTLQFNGTTQEGNGVIKYYAFKNITYNGKTYVTYSAQYFSLLRIRVKHSTSITSININYYNVTFNSYIGILPVWIWPGQVYVMLNGTVYNYGHSYWIMGGNYSASYSYKDILNGTLTYDVKKLEIKTPQGSQTYNFPNLPSYLYINSTMTIIAYYDITYLWYRL